MKPRRIPPLVTLFAALLAYLLWPRPALWLYTSPDVMVRGKPVRFQVLIPAGWKVTIRRREGEQIASYERVGIFSGIWSSPIAFAEPAEPYRWLPAWLRRWVAQERRDGGAFLVIDAQPAGPGDANQPITRSHSKLVILATKQGIEYEHADREVVSGRLKYHLHYVRPDAEAFDATYRQVCESFEVVQ
jgi:hypothetical protein